LQRSSRKNRKSFSTSPRRRERGQQPIFFDRLEEFFLLQNFFSDEDQKKFCSSRVEEQKKKKKKEKMSFVFRGSRGDLESGLQNFMTARRSVVRSFVLFFSCCSILYQAFLLSLSLVLVEESPMLLLKPELCLCLCLCISLSWTLLKSFTRICLFGQLTASVDDDRRFSL
jgi:hypothetical protein